MTKIGNIETKHLRNYLENNVLDTLSPEAQSEIMEKVISLNSLIEEKLNTSSIHPLEGNLPSSIINPLSYKGVKSFEDLLKFSEDEVSHIRGIGRVRMKILLERFEELGYSFKK